MAVDAVLFDLDETLIRYDRSALEILDVAFEQVGVGQLWGATEFENRYEQFLPQSESIDHLRELIFMDIAESKGHDPALGRKISAVYAEERDHAEVHLLPGAPALLEALEDRPLGLVTNGDPEMQRPKLEATGLDDRFETIVYAGHDTESKPDPEPFHRALDDLGVDAPAGAFVGNDPVADVGGAQGVGLRSVWIRNGTDEQPLVTPDLTIDRLDELLGTWVVE